MNYFNITKYQTVEENIPYSSMVLYKLLSEKMSIDELFKKYALENNIVLNLNLERILLLCVTFLYSIQKIKLNNNLIERWHE
ncbi:MAG: YydC [Clostridiaceae bacterium]|jgi:hypothetical protein|nr:YydC [Clostridiaceae bacterium]